MSKSRTYTTGTFGGNFKVEVTNRQNCVEYKVLDGCCSESDIRSRVGNDWAGVYDHNYSGYYGNRKDALTRIQNEIEETKQKLSDLEFALKVTKKKDWVKID